VEGVTDSGGRFGELLRQYRAAACLTQEEVAHRSGLSVRAVRDMERGRTARPFGRTVRLLAEALELGEPARLRLVSALQTPAGEDAEPAPDSRRSRTRPGMVPRQLPAVAAHFAGRAAELDILAGLARKSADGGVQTAVISAIGGTAGVGKTALAVHFGHQVAALFPDGQLYVNLAGFSPAGSPLAPDQAVRGFLDALGVDQEQIPASLDGQAGLYRSLLAGRRMLVVLDNAVDEQQVRPLLPGCAGCLALVTSRRQLAGLVAAEGAQLITLTSLPSADALKLLASRLGAGRVAAEPGAAAGLITLCGGLPLALAIAGARGAARPGLPIATLAGQLRQADRRLDALDTGDPGASIRPVFSWSYQALSQPAARMFRLLGLHPGPDISLSCAASMAGLDRAGAGALLDELTAASLLTEHHPARYGLHDLLRAYAAEQAANIDGGPQQRAATSRLLDHYLHATHAAALALDPASPLTLSPPPAEIQLEQPGSYQQALDWFTAEHRTLLALVSHAAAIGADTHAWQIPWAMETYLDRQGHWSDLAATQLTALAAAERLGDTAAQAHMHRNIAHARSWLGSADDAGTHLSRSLQLYRQLGDNMGQGRIHLDMAVVYGRWGRFGEALDHARQALPLIKQAGDRGLKSRALNAVGWHSAHLGDHGQALNSCEQALELAREVGDTFREATVLDSLGYIRHQMGQHAEAIRSYQCALRIRRQNGTRYQLAATLMGLGDTWLSSGDLHAARGAWQEALTILDDLGHHDAAQVQAKLAQETVNGCQPDHGLAR
jgi:tetratricopeptide (TPR) repeat protein/transcriptional regulator with XRE-family HTH domain